MDGERLFFNPFDEDSCCHHVVGKSQDCYKVARVTQYGHNFPESFTVRGIEGLSQVNESLVNILALFPTFLMKLPGHTDNVRGS